MRTIFITVALALATLSACSLYFNDHPTSRGTGPDAGHGQPEVDAAWSPDDGGVFNDAGPQDPDGGPIDHDGGCGSGSGQLDGGYNPPGDGGEPVDAYGVPPSDAH